MNTTPLPSDPLGSLSPTDREFVEYTSQAIESGTEAPAEYRSKVYKKYGPDVYNYIFKGGKSQQAATAAAYPQSQAVIQGLGQGASFGLSDEMAAAIPALRAGAGRLAEGEIGAIPGAMKQAYSQDVESSRAYMDELKRQWPKTFMASDIAGGVLPTVAGGLGGLAAKGLQKGIQLAGPTVAGELRGLVGQLPAAGEKALQVAPAIAAGAGMGALGGVGYSEAPTAKEIAMAGFGGAALGGAAGGALPLVGRAVPKLIEGITAAPKYALSLAGGVSPTAIAERFRRPLAIQSAPLREQLAKSVGSEYEALKKGISEGSGESFQLLKESKKEIPTGIVSSPLDDAMTVASEMIGPQKDKAIRALQKIKEDLIRPKVKVQEGVEFSPEKLSAEMSLDNIAQLGIQRDALVQAMRSDPAAKLSKYANRQTMEIPENLGLGSGFRKEGDQIASNLGFTSSEEAREAFQNYLKKRNQLSSIDQQIRNEKIGLSESSVLQEIGAVPAEKIKNAIWSIDNLMSKEAKKGGIHTQMRQSYQTARKGLDNILKEGEYAVPGYKEKMAEVASDVGARERASAAFGSPEATASLLRSLGSKEPEQYLGRTEELKKLGEYLGRDLVQETRDVMTKEAFQRINPLTGYNLGIAPIGFAAATAAGIPMPAAAAIGGLASLARGTLGPRVTGATVDLASSIPGSQALQKVLSMAPDQLGKYQPQLQQAASTGVPALLAIHATLYNRDPKYRDMIDQYEPGKAQPKSRIMSPQEQLAGIKSPTIGQTAQQAQQVVAQRQYVSPEFGGEMVEPTGPSGYISPEFGGTGVGVGPAAVFGQKYPKGYAEPRLSIAKGKTSKK